jgi:HSP20 family protein
MSTGTGLARRSLFGAEPFRELQERLSRVFDGGLRPFAFPEEETLSLSGWSPSCDIYETDNEFVIKAELPEVKKENIRVTVENNIVTIRGERKFEEETKRENYRRVERRYGEFMRSFTLPTMIDGAKINAEFKEGMLRVALPKR